MRKTATKHVPFFLAMLTATSVTWAEGSSLSAPSATQPVQLVQQTLTSMTNAVILPAHQRWDRANREFSASVTAFCNGKEKLTDVRMHWRNAQEAWLVLQPALVLQESRELTGSQVQFWPDKRNLAARQVEAFVDQAKDPQQAIASASVAVRGLGASEYLLFDQQADIADAKKAKRYCPTLQAIAGYQQSLSAAVLRPWQSGSAADALLKTPNALYADPAAVLADVLGTQVDALDMMLKKFSIAAGVPAGKQPQPLQGEAWRSGCTLSNLKAGVVALQALWDGKGLRSLVAARDEDLAVSIDQTFVALEAQWTTVDKPLPELLATPAGVQALQDLHATLKMLESLYGRQVAKTLGVQIGFNGADGD